jgi:MinD-like ATPase involved in chromosome partitioning or flagellar assembly
MMPDLRGLMQRERQTIFVTFYSFKGGVGRTMALLNAACILAGRGRRVLMIDFDLEAPGLTQLANSGTALKAETPSAGLVELISDFLNDPESSVLADETNSTAFRNRYVCSLQIPPSLLRLQGGSLDLMPCGRLDESYESRLYSIKFDDLYEEGVGLPLFQRFKQMILDSGLYDYILVDSRTGFSDEGSICTRDLADHIFVIMGLNRQNVEGTARFLERLDQSDWHEDQERQVVFVASPVPQGQEPLVEERLNSARDRFRQTRFRPDFKLQIPYHPRLSLDEEPFRYSWSETNLFPIYLQIYGELRKLALDNVSPALAWQHLQEREYGKALAVLNEVRIDNPDDVSAFLRQFLNSNINLDQESRSYAEPFYQMWLDLDGHDATLNTLIRLGFGFVLLRQGDYNRAKIQLAAALDLAGRGRVTRKRYELREHEAFARQFIGLLNSLRGQYKEALDQSVEAVRIFDDLQDQPNSIYTKYAIATIYTNMNEYNTAQDLFDSVSQYYKKVGDTLSAVRVDMAVGILKVQSGNIVEGIRFVEQANQEYERLDASNDSLANGKMNYVWVLERSGDLTSAAEQLSKYWGLIQRFADADAKYEAYVLRAKIKKAQGDFEGAREDARVAAEFYRAQDVQTVLAREAEDLTLV